jgi:hypothetical protein
MDDCQQSKRKEIHLEVIATRPAKQDVDLHGMANQSR